MEQYHDDCIQKKLVHPVIPMLNSAMQTALKKQNTHTQTIKPQKINK